MGVLGAVEVAKRTARAVPGDPSEPLATVLGEAHSLEAACIVSCSTLVPPVRGPVDLSKVGDHIVGPIAVNVINGRWPDAIDAKPSQTMSLIEAAVDLNLDVTVLPQAAGDLTHSALPSRLLPSEDPSLRIVVKQLPQTLHCQHR